MLNLSPGITIYICTMAFLFGAVFASFLSCMGWRLSTGESVLKGRSHCDHCGHPLAWRDLIPIVSFVLGKGRCAYCKEKLSPLLLWGEIILSCFFVVLTLKFDVTAELLLYLFFVCILYLISVTDIYNRLIPDSCLLVGIAVRFFWEMIFSSPGIEGMFLILADGLFISVPLLFLVLLMEKIRGMEMMGGGDIKLVFVMGLYLGWQRNLLALFLGCVFGILFMAGKIKKEGEEATFSFGPFLSLGAVISLLIGGEMIHWYLSLFS